MPTTFEKLNCKQHAQILVLNAPASFERELATLPAVEVLRKLSDIKRITFALAFVTKQKEVDSLAKAITRKTEGDAIVWFAYPKGTSKRYTCEFNRDSGWAVLGQCGFEVVRQVAIDEDWSALRFRRVEFIKSMTRNKKLALSKAGRRRAAKS